MAIGIRPERIGRDANDIGLQCTVGFVGMLGSETLIDLDINGIEMLAMDVDHQQTGTPEPLLSRAACRSGRRTRLR